jgi:hypothetical protein
MMKLSNNLLDAEFNLWARDKDFSSEEAFNASLSTWRGRQREIKDLREEVICLREEVNKYRKLWEGVA